MGGDGSRADFGDRLRAARERRGVSLRELANKTRISLGVLEALERGDVSRLPGGIFGRAFVRSYAAEVGLDPEATIEAFLALFPREAMGTGYSQADVLEDGDALESSRRLVTTFLWLLAFSIPLAGVVLYFASRGVSPSTSARPDASQGVARADESGAEPPIDVAPAPAQPPVSPTAAVVRATDAAGAPAARLLVDIVSTRECWLSAVIDGDRSVYHLLTPGERRTLEVRRELVLNLGDATAIELKLNGAPARPLGRAGEVVTARMNLSNYKDYLQ